MRFHRLSLPVCPGLLVLLLSSSALQAQGTGGTSLPATAPTQVAPTAVSAPMAATAISSTSTGGGSRAGRVSCEGGQLTVRADNSSLNQILRAISRCTGMRITGGVSEQRVFGNYGPAAPATVLATLLDGTGSNMLLKETATDQPAELILSPRTGGVTPPPPPSDNDAESTGDLQPPAPNPQQNPYQQPGLPAMMRSAGVPRGPRGGMQAPDQTPVPQPITGSAVTSPPSIPLGNNNVNGSPSNTSPTAATLPTVNSISTDSLATPATAPSPSGIVDAPNPPPAGSDTAAVWNGTSRGMQNTTNTNPNDTNDTSTPGTSTSTSPANNENTPTQPSTELTPEQIFQQLQQRQQQQQQQQQQDQQVSPQ